MLRSPMCTRIWSATITSPLRRGLVTTGRATMIIASREKNAKRVACCNIDLLQCLTAQFRDRRLNHERGIAPIAQSSAAPVALVHLTRVSTVWAGDSDL